MAKQTEKTKSPKEFEDAVKLTGFGKFNFFILLSCGGCLLCVIIETISMSFVIPPAQCDLNLNLQERGILYSISFLGVVLSSHLWGYLADTRGRKKIIVFSLFSSATCSLLSSMVPWSWLFIVLRFCNGALIGGPSAVIYAFSGEFHDNVYRPKVVTWISTSVALANLYLPVIAWILLPMEWKFDVPFLPIYFRPWRLLIIMCTIPSWTFGTLLCFLPESPKYLLTQNKKDEVLAILTKMFVVNTGKKAEDFPVSEIIWREHEHIEHNAKESVFASMWKQTVPLFKRLHLKETLSVCVMQFGIFFSNSAVMMWFPELVNSLSEYAKEVPQYDVGFCDAIEFYEQQKIQQDIQLEKSFDFMRQIKTCKDTINTDVYKVTLVLSACNAIIFIVVGFIINLVGKKTLIIGFLTVISVLGIAAQNLYGYYTILVFISVFVMGAVLVGVVNAMAVDLYPTQVRAMALAVSLLFGRLGAMAGSNIAGQLYYHQCDYIFYVLLCVQLVVIIVTLLLPGSNKKSQFEIQA